MSVGDIAKEKTVNAVCITFSQQIGHCVRKNQKHLQIFLPNTLIISFNFQDWYDMAKITTIGNIAGRGRGWGLGQGILVNAWLNCFTLPTPGAAEVCSLEVLLVVYVIYALPLYLQVSLYPVHLRGNGRLWRYTTWAPNYCSLLWYALWHTSFFQ